MNLFNTFLHYIYNFFVVIAVLIMCYGFFLTIYKIIFKRKEVSPSDSIRNGFDKSVLFGLQILIVADIIETIIAPDLLSVARVFGVVIIRTIMSFSLNWEIENHH